MWRVAESEGSAARRGRGEGGGCAGASGNYVTDNGKSNDTDMIFRSKGVNE